MNVNLGTLEVTDAERRRIGFNGKLATREEIREWAFATLINTLESTLVFGHAVQRKRAAQLRRSKGIYTESEKALGKRR